MLLSGVKKGIISVKLRKFNYRKDVTKSLVTLEIDLRHHIILWVASVAVRSMGIAFVLTNCSATQLLNRVALSLSVCWLSFEVICIDSYSVCLHFKVLRYVGCHA